MPSRALGGEWLSWNLQCVPIVITNGCGTDMMHFLLNVSKAEKQLRYIKWFNSFIIFKSLFAITQNNYHHLNFFCGQTFKKLTQLARSNNGSNLLNLLKSSYVLSKNSKVWPVIELFFLSPEII